MKLISRKDAVASNLQRYYTGAPCKHGHICERYTKSTNCIVCQSDSNKSDDQKYKQKLHSSLESTKEKNRLKSSAFHKKNRERILLEMKARNKKYYLANKEKIIKAAGDYQKNNATKRTRYKANWAKEKKLNDPQFASLLMMRKIVARTCERIKQSRKQHGRTIHVLGYTAIEFKIHIERQFKNGMTWENYGLWHIDHIRPCASFDLTSIDDFNECWALSNLQPLWAEDNLRKSAKYERA